MFNKKAFTLIEISVTAIIIGVVIAFIIPSYNMKIEQEKSKEAVHTLTTLLESEKRYLIEHGSYTWDINNLDVTIQNSENFKFKSAANGHVRGPMEINLPIDFQGHIYDFYLRAKRINSNNEYFIYVTPDGKAYCQTFTIGFCEKLGYGPSVLSTGMESNNDNSGEAY